VERLRSSFLDRNGSTPRLEVKNEAAPILCLVSGIRAEP
jgi:hypothetical protein